MTYRKSLFTSAALIALIAVAYAATSAADPAPTGRTTSPVLTDTAIRDWLATHPEAVDKIVRDSLLRQPGLISEVNMAMQAKQRADREAKLRDALPAAHAALYDDPRDGREGAAKPAATVVVFGDGECVYCKALQPNLARLVAEHPDIAVIYKEFPILGPESVLTAKVALAAVAQGQGKFAAFHAALMASKIPEHQLKDEQVFEMAKSAGLDIDRLKTDMAAPEIEAKIAANKALGASLGITGTPGVLLGEQLVPGNLPYESLEKMMLAGQGRAKAAAITSSAK